MVKDIFKDGSDSYYPAVNQDLLQFVKSRVESYLENCDLIASSFELTLLQEDDSKMLDIYLDELNFESECVDDDSATNTVNNFISNLALATLKDEKIKSKRILIREQSAKKLPVDNDTVQKIEEIEIDTIAQRDWVNDLSNEEGFNLLDQFKIDTSVKVEDIITRMDKYTPWNAEQGLSDKEVGKLVNSFMFEINSLIKITNRIAHSYPECFLSYIKNRHDLLNSLKKKLSDDFNIEIAKILQKDIPDEEPAMSRKERRALKKAKYLVEKQVTIVNKDEPKEVKVDIIETEAKESIEVSDEYVSLGEFEFDFPWMERREDYEVNMLKGREQDVFLVRAMKPELEKVSLSIREGMHRNDNGEDKVDLKIKQVVKRISEGIMPWTNTNSVKALSTDLKDINSDYADEKGIWYSFDISHNATRVYFTVKDPSEELQKISGRKSSMVVVLAEADKARQIEVLTIITNLSERVLKAHGAGSV